MSNDLEFSINSNEAVMFPMYCPDEVEACPEFDEAFLLHIYPRIQNDIVEAVHKYHEAFENGCLEAGVNLLNIIARTTSNALAQNSKEPRFLQNKLMHYIEGLECEQHPAGVFYRSITMICGIMESDDYNKAYQEGWNLMATLCAEENEFALAMQEYVSIAEN